MCKKKPKVMRHFEITLRKPISNLDEHQFWNYKEELCLYLRTVRSLLIYVNNMNYIIAFLNSVPLSLFLFCFVFFQRYKWLWLMLNTWFLNERCYKKTKGTSTEGVLLWNLLAWKEQLCTGLSENFEASVKWMHHFTFFPKTVNWERGRSCFD